VRTGWEPTEPWCSDCTGSNRRCSEPSSSTSRSPPIDLPHTSRKIETHPTITTSLNQKAEFKNRVSDSNYHEINPNFFFEWNSKL
jgi:hypothetical protein